MKKFLLLFVLLTSGIMAWATDYSSNFGFRKQAKAEDYQQYVGKCFFVRQAFGSLERWEKSGFNYSEYYDGRTYTITKIKVKDVTVDNEPNREILVMAVENGTKAKIKFKGYEQVAVGYSMWSGLKQWPLIAYMPIVFEEPFEEYKKQHIGQLVSHKMVKDKYEITEIFMGAGEGDKYATAEPNVKVRNTRTGEQVSCLYSAVTTKPFEQALKGSYTTALLRVEKPEDSSDRYGETKTVCEGGINKYSYKDSVIDILIFGNLTEFSFVLKNVSNNSIKIIWNEAAFVGLDASSSKIMHAGIKYSERDRDQPSTTLIKGAKLEDIAVPIDNVYYDEGVKFGYTTIGNGWKKRSMLPTSYQGMEAGEIRLMLPIQVKEVINEYTFVFGVGYTYLYPELLNL